MALDIDTNSYVGSAPIPPMSSVPKREEMSKEYRWDLSSLYSDDKSWEEDYRRAKELVEKLTEYEGHTTEGASTLLDTLEAYEDLMRTVSNLSAYARMKRDEDTTDDTYQGLTARARSLSSEAGSAASFLEPEIQDMERKEIDGMIEEDPELETYEHYFDDVLRTKDHTRSSEAEDILAKLSEVTGAPGDIYNMLANADMEFPTVQHPEGDERKVTLSNFTKLQKHPDRGFRRRVYEAFYDEWGDVRNAVGTAYKNAVKKDVKLARARNYETARERALDGPNVPVEVYDNLIDTVRANLDSLHRHAKLKREAIDGDELRMWDLYVPVVQEDSPEIGYEQACEYITDAVKPLGEDYASRLAEGLDSRWVDVYETENKQSGAYSGGTYDSQPLILMNYQDDVKSMYTLAHELGHSMHSEYTSESQPYIYSGYEIFVAEVASTVNETLLTHRLLDTVDDEGIRRHVLNEYLERFRSTLYRQTMFAEFEARTHGMSENGEPLTPDRLDGLYRELKSEYYEPAVLDDRIDREWMRIPHFYRAFYVYQYATGISAAVALVDGILNEGDEAARRYIDFLRSGSSKYPMELLKDAGVDMGSSEPIEAAISTYSEYLDEFEGVL
jgi:oligoendopeptidase F